MPRSAAALVESLGLPGLVDVHTHFLPPRMAVKVRAQFDEAGPLIGRPWPLHYRADDDALVETLRSLGVRRFTALSYAHRPGMAEWLNDWAFDFADRVPEVPRCATFFPEPGVEAYVARRLEAGAEVWKLHVQVGRIDVTDPALAEAHERVHLDTTMSFTDFFEDASAPFPPDLLPRLRDLREKVLLGSDFPNIPYAYEHQLAALERLDLGDDWLGAVLWHNGARLLGGEGTGMEEASVGVDP